MARITHADTRFVRADAPMLTDTRLTEMDVDIADFHVWVKIGRYRVGLTPYEIDKLAAHAITMKEMHIASRS